MAQINLSEFIQRIHFHDALFYPIRRGQFTSGVHTLTCAIPMVGGRDTLQISASELASAWILRQEFADVFIGYAHYANALMGQTDIRCVTIPAEHNILCEYQLAMLENSREVNRLVDFILSHEGQAILAAAGFSPVTSQC